MKPFKFNINELCNNMKQYKRKIVAIRDVVCKVVAHLK